MSLIKLLPLLLLITVAAVLSDASRVLLTDTKPEKPPPNSPKVSPSPTQTPISPPIPKEQPKKKEKEEKKAPPVKAEAASFPPPPAGPGKAPQSSKGKESGGKKNDGKKKGSGGDGGKSRVEETCDGGVVVECKDGEGLVACLRHPDNDSKEFVVLLQNTGENALDVNVIVPTSIRIDAKKLNLAKHGVGKINVSVDDTNNLKIVLNAGKGNCVLQISPSISDWNLLQRFPAYATQLTPMYGAYFLFVTFLIVGGTWACCKFRKRGRRVDAGAPYQQLEMGVQTQSSAEDVEASTADGWDQGWDDDWDGEDVSTRHSDKSPTATVSSNGLASRSANKKNGWDIDWDD